MRLVVVSNRVTQVSKSKPAAGGLAQRLLDYRQPQLKLIPLRVQTQQFQCFFHGSALGHSRRHPLDWDLLGAP